MKIPFSEVEPEFRLYLKSLLGEGVKSPYWDYPNNISVGIGKTGNRFALMVWQGDRSWVVQKIEQKTHSYIPPPCPYCGSDRTRKYGRTKSGRQRCQCRNCTKTY